MSSDIGWSLAGAISRWLVLLGVPGVIVGLVSVAAFAFSLIVVGREYDQLRKTGEQVAEGAIREWISNAPVGDLQRSLVDYAQGWLDEPTELNIQRLESGLEELARGAEQESPRFAMVTVTELLMETGTATSTKQYARTLESVAAVDRGQRFQVGLPDVTTLAEHQPVRVTVSYVAGSTAEDALSILETSYRRLLLALIGLSGYSLLCLGAMVAQGRALRDRAARESAQQATLDLADRTCHELGNVVFVLSNEEKNLTDHLDLFERLTAHLPEVLKSTVQEAGLGPQESSRIQRLFTRALAAKGLDPEQDLQYRSVLARDVVRQIAVCSDYIGLTVRELDAYLKQSTQPVEPSPVDVAAVVQEAITLLGPRIESASGMVEVSDKTAIALADRRLLLHALVNLIKNALEAGAGDGARPRISIQIESVEHFVRLTVLDNGPGIASTLRANLFEPGSSTKGPGRGRGLSIARDSIHAQDGSLRLADHPGRGACFVIELPRTTRLQSIPDSVEGA